jgi:dihydroflavonol-4-reductase
MSLKYLVTGATGFVGNNVVRQLIESKAEVICFARSEKKFKEVFKDADIEVVYGDVTNYDDLKKAVNENDEFIIIHTAAVVSIGDKKKNKLMDITNCQAVEAVIKVCKNFPNVVRLVHVSSVHAIPEGKKRSLIKEVSSFDPNLVVGKYAKSKATSTQLVVNAIKEGLNANIVHPAGIIGPDDYSNTSLTQMIADFANNKIPAALQGGYDFVDVRDVAYGIIQASKYPKSGECFILSNTYISVKQLLDCVTNTLNIKKKLTTLPMWLAYIALPFLGIYASIKRTDPLYTTYSLYTLKSNSNFTHEKATNELDYHPRPLEDTIKDTIKSLRKQNLIK